MTARDLQDELRRLTVTALRETEPGLREFSRLFETCSDAFEQGNDSNGMDLLRQALPNLSDFAGFCNMVLQNAGNDLSDRLRDAMEEQARLFEGALTALLQESQHGDYVAVAEVLRLDFCPLMAQYLELFPRLADELETAA